MVQVHTCVSVHCDQCADPLSDEADPGTPTHHPSEDTAHATALAAGWVIAAGRWWCSCCGPVLTCEAKGHVFTPWQPGTPTEQGTTGGYRYCRRCCLHETTPTLRPAPGATEELA